MLIPLVPLSLYISLDISLSVLSLSFAVLSPGLGLTQASAPPPQRESIGPVQGKRNAFSLCTLHRSVNAALADYKRRMCGPNNATSTHKTINVANKDY